MRQYPVPAPRSTHPWNAFEPFAKPKSRTLEKLFPAEPSPQACSIFRVGGLSISFPISLMFNVNRVTLLGNVTRDPDIRATKAGRTVSNIGFATNRAWRDGEGALQREPEFHRLVCFGPLAEFSEKRVKKGVPLYVEGRLHTSSYEDKKGAPQSRTEIVVDRLVLLGSKKKGVVETAESDEE